MLALETLSGGHSTLSTHLIKPNYLVIFPHRRSTTVSLKPHPLNKQIVRKETRQQTGK